ncbi:hypothetical protein [Jiella sp. M17.18]|uniref:hypothetical protein n=1 Tax=Jiella sp. M17.18 TaxID=3234247 RepID=UPI0034DE6017
MKAVQALTLTEEADPSGGLPEIAQEIDAVAADIEKDFLAVGDCLIGAIGLFDEMRRTIEGSAARLDGDDLAVATTVIASLPERMRDVSLRLEEEDAVIVRVAQAVKALDRPFSSLASSTQIIEAVAMNARIVSAGVPDLGATDLAVFSDDVLELARKAVATVKSLRGEEEALGGLVREAQQRSKRFRQTFDILSLGAATSLHAALERFEGHAVTERQRAEEAGHAIGSRSAAFAGIVPALQVGDATRQRLEHVASAVRLDIATPALLALQQRQVEAAGADLFDDVHAIEGRLSPVLEQAAETFRLFVKKDDDDAVRFLADVVGRLVENLHEAAHEHQRNRVLKEAIEAAVGRIGNHTATMRDLEFSMRMVSLNTAISCSNLGSRGRALSVISLQLRELVGEMLTRSDDASDMSEALGSACAAIGAGLQDANEVAAIGREATGSLDRLKQALEDHRGGFAAVLRVSRKVDGLLQDADAALGRQAVLVSRIEDCADAIQVWIPDASAEAQHDLSPEIEALLQATYTMDAERDVHDRFLGRAPFQPPRDVARDAVDLANVLF